MIASTTVMVMTPPVDVPDGTPPTNVPVGNGFWGEGRSGGSGAKLGTGACWAAAAGGASSAITSTENNEHRREVARTGRRLFISQSSSVLRVRSNPTHAFRHSRDTHISIGPPLLLVVTVAQIAAAIGGAAQSGAPRS